MAARVCDREPCDRLKNTMVHFTPEGGGSGTVEVTMAPKKEQDHVPRRVVFEYCPFCGTRIDAGLIASARQRGYLG